MYLVAIWNTLPLKRGVENVLLDSITLCRKSNGILLECFSRECFHVLFVYFKLQMERVMVAEGRGLGSQSPV